VRIRAGKNAVGFYRTDSPTSLHLAFPGSNYEIDVADPSATDAQRLVASGAIEPVATPAAPPLAAGPTPVAVSPAELSELSAALHQPIYWVGPSADTTYELTRTAAGLIYLRYLPRGVAVGAPAQYLTIGTYPLSRAYATGVANSKLPGAVTIAVPGAIAYSANQDPTSVYLAFPGVNEQVEVFDPSSTVADQTVMQHEVHAVSPEARSALG
jgi:hypothetical protein